MVKSNPAKFRGTTLYTEEYLWLDSMRKSSMEPISMVLRRVLEGLRTKIIQLSQAIAVRDRTITYLQGVAYQLQISVCQPVQVVQTGKVQGTRW